MQLYPRFYELVLKGILGDAVKPKTELTEVREGHS